MSSMAAGSHLEAGAQGPDPTCDEETTSLLNSEQLSSISALSRAPGTPMRLVLKAFHYIHLQDQDTGKTRLVKGPCSVSTRPSEKVTVEETPMVAVPREHYCVVENPAARTKNDHVAFDIDSQVQLQHGEREVRLHQEPFPLYPGERLERGGVQPLPVVGEGEALRIRALQDTIDGEGNQRGAGEEWLVTKRGTYTPNTAEKVVEQVKLQQITLTNQQYCTVCTPSINNKPQRRIVRGPQSFFLGADDYLDGGVRALLVLEAHDAIDLKALEPFTDETGVARCIGERWTVRGPAVLAQPAEVEVLHVAPLSGTGGVYVQDAVTGVVRAAQGEPYLLAADDQLWSKELPPDVETLLTQYRAATEPEATDRDKTQLVQFFVPQNRCAVIEDQQTGDGREVHGPQLATLLPDELFRVFSLPDGSPVQPGCRQSLTLPWLGEQYCLTDVITTGGKEGQGGRTLTVNVAWKLFYPTSVPVGSDGADEAYKRLRHCLQADTAKGRKMRTLYEVGDFRFNVTVTSDVTKPPGKSQLQISSSVTQTDD